MISPVNNTQQQVTEFLSTFKKRQMLQSLSQFVPSPSKFRYQKCEKTFKNNKNNILRIKNSITFNKSHKYEYGIPCRLLHHPLESELPLLDESNDGIGIDKFFDGKNIFITGATGLVGKAFVEKLLRSTSVGKIYLLVKAKDKEAAFQRLHDDIINSELFKNLRDEYGVSYETFVSEKLIPVLGNICEPNLGMDSISARALMDEVDVIINSAASTALHQRYDVLLEENVNAPQRLMRFAKTCKNIKLFVQISTAYVNGRREGLIMEKPLIMGENRRKEEETSSFFMSSRLDVTDEINLAMKMCKDSIASEVTIDLKRLGLERAAFYGWYNTYHLTKAMAEMVLNEIREDVPLLVIRPTVIESSYNEPFPGWIQGNRMFDPVISAYGKGNLPAYLCDPQVHMDIVPVDMVVNTTIAAMAKHGTVKKPDVNVYHAATGHVNSLQFCEFFEYLHEYFTLMPITGTSQSIKRMKFFNEFGDFSKYTRDEISSQLSSGKTSNAVADNDGQMKLGKHYKAKVAYAEQLCKMYEFIGFINARFDTGNTRKLLEDMSEDEKKKFEVDATKIVWRKYVTEIHIPGLMKHVHGTKMAV